MSADTAADRPRHTIRVATRRTGLTAATLRAWERRYGAVRPARSDSERRLYSDADIERLRLLRELAGGGHAIAGLARLSTAELQALAREERSEARGGGRRRGTDDAGAAPSADAGGRADGVAALLDECERAVRALDGGELHRLLVRALVELGPLRFVEAVAAPVCHRIGALWEEGALTVAHEHVASAAIRQSLGFLLETLRVADDDAPALVATTPAGERHEFGAMMAAAMASLAGWRVTYLGPDLPAADVAAATRQAGARVLALSVVVPGDDGALAAELRRLRVAVGRDVEIVVGGAGAAGRASALADGGARHVPDLAGLRRALEGAERA